MRHFKVLHIILLGIVVSMAAIADKATVPVYSTECIFKAVAEKKGIVINSNISLPKVYFESKTPLKQYQDAVESQSHFRPDIFSNVYVFTQNEIYLNDEAKLYGNDGRVIDDALAHELTHFVQAKYQNVDLTDAGSDENEIDAIQVQTWFRETYMATGKSPCK